ncbi:exonuclease V subunit beta [compost metagenome]
MSILTSLVNKSPYFHRWAQAALIKIKASRLAYDKERKCIFLENTTNWDKFEKHKTEMLNLKLQLKRMGYFSFEDTFLFAQAAIGNDNIIRILRKRFKYVFIDEFQDTKPHSINILKEIFMVKGNVLQFIGDPNQTLDFYGEKPEVDQDITFELKICNRFGENIARHLPIVINEVSIESIEGKVSFDPLMIIYKENNQLIPFYEKLLEDYANNNEEFRANILKDSILSIRNDTIFQFEYNGGNQVVNSYSIKSNDAFTQHMLQLINELIFKKISVSRVFEFDLRKFIKNHHEQLNIKKCLISNIKSKKLDVSYLKNCINAILNEQGSSLINNTNDIFNKLLSIIETMNIGTKDENKLEETKNKLVYSTIHSAKGETHRSVLLIDSKKSQMIHTQMLKSFYNNSGENYDTKWVERNLLYVAMSRPTHLFAFGMNYNFIKSEEVEKFKDLGWRIEYSF